MKSFFRLLVLALLLTSCARGRSGIRPETAVPDFSLTSTSGEAFQLSQHQNDTVVLIFWNAFDSVSKAYEDRIQRLYDEFSLKGVRFFFIAGSAGENEENIRRAAELRHITFPILMDSHAEAATLFGIEKIPEALVVHHGILAYRGAIDGESRFNQSVKDRYLHDVLTAILKGSEVRIKETEPYGKKIK